MADMTGTADRVDTADTAETAETADREPLSRIRSSSRNDGVRNLRRDGGHDRRDGDDNRNRCDGNDDDACSCQPPEGNASNTRGGAHLGMLIEAAIV